MPFMSSKERLTDLIFGLRSSRVIAKVERPRRSAALAKLLYSKA
jgi:hypothetical protein